MVKMMEKDTTFTRRERSQNLILQFFQLLRNPEGSLILCLEERIHYSDTRMEEEEFKSSPKKYSEAEADDSTKFNNSLQELKDLCSQLHHAADYCEKAFVKAEEARDVIENTKEYICRAVITVIDRLGSVSAKLECRISTIGTATETELRIDGLT